MEFKPKYITPDGEFEVDIDSLDIKYELVKEERCHSAKGITNVFIKVCSTQTQMVSTKTLYVNNKGLFFKVAFSYYRPKNKSRYYISELIERKKNDND